MQNEQSLYDKELLHEHVSSAQNIQDLVSILQCIPFTKVQDMIHTHIDEIDVTETKHTLCQSISIENILPECIIQYMLSFTTLNHGKLVNKKWKQYSEKNEEIFIKKQLESIMYDGYDPDWDNQTWVVHPCRKNLYEWEDELGWKGPINTVNIEQALRSCRLADRIMFHNGTYTHSYHYGIGIGDNVHLIGIGDNVIFKDDSIGGGGDEYQRAFLEIAGGSEIANSTSSIYIENIKFDCNNMYGNHNNEQYGPIGYIVVHDLACLFMKNCVLLNTGCNAENGIITMGESCLEVNNCEFIGYDKGMVIGISGHTESVSVTDCIFRNCGDPIECVTVLVDEDVFGDVIHHGYRQKSVKMILNGNIFTNMKN